MLFFLITLSFFYTYHHTRETSLSHRPDQTPWMIAEFLRQAVAANKPDIALFYANALDGHLHTAHQHKRLAMLTNELKEWAHDPHHDTRAHDITQLIHMALDTPMPKTAEPTLPANKTVRTQHLSPFIKIEKRSGLVAKPTQTVITDHRALLMLSWSLQTALTQHDTESYQRALNTLAEITSTTSAAYSLIQTLKQYPLPNAAQIDLTILDELLAPKRYALLLTPDMFIGMA
jgi:hypothetical protein